MSQILAGRYELEVPLGRGGSGEVWRGSDLATRRPVAVKLVELAEIDDVGLLAETIGRFRREATVIAGLRHPNIVTALDAGRVGNELFLVMELAQGISLASMLEQRAARGMGLFPVASVLRIAGQASAGLAAAHAAGVVHRDIKPSNLMVAARLDTKIIDFGIARLLADNSPRLTMPSHTVGTPAYISPEQARGGNVDGRADLYSLGCVLYELLAGRPPFLADLPEALLMMQVVDQAVPLSVIRPDLPAGLPELVSDLMEKDLAANPANTAQVISRITAISAPLDGGVPVHEADRQTVRADDPPAPGAGRQPVAEVRAASDLAAATVTSTAAGGSGHDEITPEAGRSTVLTPERPANPAGPGTSAATVAPAWPGPPGSSHRRRRRWRGAVSTVLTAAIVAGVGIYAWERMHGTLKITAVAVAPAQQPGTRCDVTVDVIGMIFTNGRGGPISYQWARGSGETSPVATVDEASGHDTVQVELNWAFHGRGTDHVRRGAPGARARSGRGQYRIHLFLRLISPGSSRMSRWRYPATPDNGSWDTARPAGSRPRSARRPASGWRSSTSAPAWSATPPS